MKVYLALGLVIAVTVPLVASMPAGGQWTWLPDAGVISRMEPEMNQTQDEPDLVNLAWKLGCKYFVAHLKYIAPDLMQRLKSKDSYTVIVPTDEAFKAFEKNIKGNLKKELKTIFYGHVLRTWITSNDLYNDDLIPSELNWDDGEMLVRFNVYSSENEDSSNPDDEIITANGGILTIQDQFASNGVIHVTDRILYPQPLNGMLTELGKTSHHTGMLLSAIEVAGLAESVMGQDAITLLAPSNRAWEALRNPDFNELLRNKIMLQSVLMNHFDVTGTFFKAGLREGDVRYSEIGGRLLITEKKGGIQVNNVTISRPDVAVENGVIHIIDKVLFPTEVEAYYKRRELLKKMVDGDDDDDDDGIDDDDDDGVE